MINQFYSARTTLAVCSCSRLGPIKTGFATISHHMCRDIVWPSPLCMKLIFRKKFANHSFHPLNKLKWFKARYWSFSLTKFLRKPLLYKKFWPNLWRHKMYLLPIHIHPSLPIFPIFPIYFIGSYKTPIIGQKFLYFL